MINWFTMERVVITGIGAVTPLGVSFSESWQGILAGRSGIAVQEAERPWRLAGTLPAMDFSSFLPARDVRTLDAFVLYASAAASMALHDAHLLHEQQETVLAQASVLVGSSRAGISSLEKAGKTLREKKKLSPFLMPSTTLFMAPATIARQYGIRGECLGISTACASGAHAIGEAYRQIRLGVTDIALAGGSEAPICEVCFEGYGRAGALTPGTTADASRPFDRGRNGFVLAEGSCMLVLESYRSARRRNAPVYAEIAGYVNRTDGHHLTQPYLPSQITVLNDILHMAGFGPDEVDHINAHGTSTQIGDRIEAEAIRTVFGERPLPVSALKSMTGHMLAASAAFEIACTALSIRDGVIPPTINVTAQDRDCPVTLTPEKISMPVKTALSQSFGFGGANAALLLKQIA